MSLGYRPHPSQTFKNTIGETRLINDMLKVEKLVKERRNADLIAFLYDLNPERYRDA